MVGATAADVAVHGRVDLGLSWFRFPGKQRGG